MFSTTLAGLRAHKLRLLATGLAIILGVGFVAGTLIFGDTAKAALFDQFARAAKNVDVSVTRPSTDKAVTRLPASTVDTLRAVSGVDSVDGRVEESLPLLDKRGKLVGNGNRPGLALSAGTVAALRPYDVVSGRAPSAAGETALDADTVTRTGYTIGDRVTVLDPQQRRQTLRLVGVVSFGTSKQYAGQAVAILTDDALAALTGATGYDQVVVTAGPGTSVTDLVGRIGATLSTMDGVEVTTGGQYRDRLANDAINQLGTFLDVLLIFAAIACVVSAFVIYNTFNILIAQRVREMALLRCVGSSRSQIFASVVLESVLVGLVAAVIGLGVGIGLGYGLFSGADAVGASLPSHAIVLGYTPMVVALLIGVGVSVVSASIPSVRATRVSPLAALRVLPLAASRGRRRWLLIAGSVAVGVLGTALTVLGSTAHGSGRSSLFLVVAGGLVNFLAVLIGSPLFIGPLTAAIGWLPGRLFGVPARLAVANARRNPGRAAATSAALMIGVGLMSAATVALATSRATSTEQLNLHYPVDYIVQSNNPGDPRPAIAPQISQELRGKPELATVAEVRTTAASLDGNAMMLGTVDPTGMGSLIGTALPMTAGSTSQFRSGSVVLFTSAAANRGKKVGDRVTISTDNDHRATLTVVALASGQSEVGDAVITWNDFGTLHESTMDNMVLARAARGVDPARSRAAVASVTDNYPLVNVASLADWRSQITGAVDTVISVVAALLAVAIVIALIGIMNTLSLSVFERTRESAVLRALGLTRGQLRATLLVEALLMGLVGAVVGVGFGVLYGWATTRVMFTGFAAVVTVPLGQLVGYVALATACATVAALLPARKAARASIVAAMAAT